MWKVTLRCISFIQSDGEAEYIYGLNENKEPKMGNLYYDRSLGKFSCIQRIGHESQLMVKFPIIEATNNPKYDLPRIPEAFIKQYYDSNKTLTKLEMRL